MTTEVTPEQWSARLRNPDSNQTSLQLRDEDAFCCLGHLADLINPDGWDDNAWYGEPGIRHTTRLRDDLPAWLSASAEHMATKLNDHLGATLPQIADWVDAGMPPDWQVST